METERIRSGLGAALLVLALPGCNGCGCTIPARAPTDHSGWSPRVDASDSDDAHLDAGRGPELLVARGDLCGNGQDDDFDGRVDEGDCPCEVGTRSACYVGAPSLAGVGECARGERTCVNDGTGAGTWDACVGYGAPREETCGNGIDEDCDARSDEGCPLAPTAESQACFTGAASAAGVGVCAWGAQRSEPVAGPDGATMLGWGPCEGAVPPSSERCNGLDDDCDGAIDELFEACNWRDDDCDGRTDEGAVCDAVRSDVLWSRFYPGSASGILRLEERLYATARFTSAPSEPCAPPRVWLEEPAGSRICVLPPAACPPGQAAQWVDEAWACVPCDLLVQFGGLFAGERTCASLPDVSCPAGQSPTFDAAARRWVWAPTCNNGAYDVHYVDGLLVCVPC